MEFMSESERFEHGGLGRDLDPTLGNIAYLGFLLSQELEVQDEC